MLHAAASATKPFTSGKEAAEGQRDAKSESGDKGSIDPFVRLLSLRMQHAAKQAARMPFPPTSHDYRVILNIEGLDAEGLPPCVAHGADARYEILQYDTPFLTGLGTGFRGGLQLTIHNGKQCN